ncbi:MAG: RHS repeat-associated core domain-containing protein, partial [Arenimonas sp.]
GAVITTCTTSTGAPVNCPGASSALDERYVFGDHLGSTDAITTKTGAAIANEAASFDAWGARRVPSSWSGAGTPIQTTTRGFTGHEQIDAAGFVHMNGRIYDPALGRFLQADPMIDAGTQGLNRYTYVLNNPLSATDPTGYLTWGEWMRVAINIGVVVATQGAAGWQGYVAAGANGFMAGAVQSGSLKGGAWGAFSAVAFHGIGEYFETAGWASNGSEVMNSGLDAGGYSAKVLAHGVMGGTVQHLQGGSFGSGFAAAGIVQAASGAIDVIDPANPHLGSALRTMAAGVVGGTVSDMTGGKFAHGFVTAAFARAFNDEFTDQRERDFAKRRALANGGRGAGRIYVTAHRVGRLGPRHLALEYTAGEGGVPMWISAGPEGTGIEGFDRLVGDSNLARPSDVPVDNITVGQVQPPAGWSRSDYFSHLIRAERNYCDCLDYDLFPGISNGYNSNSFISGLIRGTGGTVNFDIGSYVGGGKPVPSTYFQPNR